MGNIIAGSLPATPLLNSNYDASFIAGILQLRYIYSMSVERIIKLFAENGFKMNKSTAHGLIRKAARVFDVLQELIIPYWKKESNQRPERIPAKDIFGQMEEVTASQRRLRNKASLLTVIV